MVVRPRRDIVLAAFCLLGFRSPAQAAEPAAAVICRSISVTIGEHSTELVVHFDRPINHERSWLFLVHDEKIVATIHPRLEAEPNVLFARIPTPPAGRYIARWIICPEGSTDRYDGDFPFTVGASSI